MAIPYSRYVFGSITWYSVLIITGILLAYVLGTRESKRLGLKKDTMLDVVLVSVPFGIIGSRVYYVLMKLDEFTADPVSVLYIWNGGVAIYGAVIGGALSVYVYSRIKKIPFASLLDIVAPGLVLAQAIGRWGNYFNREAFGPVITEKFWQFFPAGVLISEGGAEVWHAATFFYESMWNVLAFLVLWLTRRRMKKRGDVFLWYLALYGCGRFLIEQLRTDSLYLLGMRVSQIVGLLTCVAVAAVFMARLYRSQKGKAFMAYLLLCLLAFLRTLLAANLWGVILTIILYVAVLGGLLLYTGTDRAALSWAGIDLLVYLALWIFGGQNLWQSPYFFYAGASVAVYLLMPYRALVKEAQSAGHEA
ncbi:MAG: prolipoprotein diacylglyceryl transferase [Clostridiales bacterium]|nr:prolipoprotein diacylglyceryl transferase [Clostridiales bacterium]